MASVEATEQRRREDESKPVTGATLLVREEPEAKIVLGDDVTTTSTEEEELPCWHNVRDAGSPDCLDLDSGVDVMHLEDARNPSQRSLERSRHLLRTGGVVCLPQQLQPHPQSSRLRSVVLKHMRLSPEILASLLDSSASLKLLSLAHCDYYMLVMEEEANEEPGRKSHNYLAKALQRHKHLQTLELKMLEDAFLLSIVRALVSSTSVQHLKLELKRRSQSDDAAAGALQHLLQSARSIQRFELRSWSSIGFGSSNNNYDSKETNAFHCIVQGLTHSPTITDVRLCSCQLDNESTRLLKNMMETKTNLGSLSLQFCDVGDIHEALVVLLSARSPSTLRCLALEHCDLRDMFPNPCDFVQLLRAVVHSRPLERLVLGCIQSPHLQGLAQSLPTMKIRELEVRVGLGLWHKKAELLEAIQRNYSLLQPVRAGDLFVAGADQQKLRENAARNLSLKEWTLTPEGIPPILWPKAFQGASRLGSTALLRALIGAEKLGSYDS